MRYTLPDLAYALDALEPHIDAKTMEIHHSKHHQAYIDNLNAAIEGRDLGNMGIEELVSAIHTLPEEIHTAVQNHGGGHANHSLFWTILSGTGGGLPGDDLARAIDDQLFGFDKFVELFTTAAMKRFGSGWAWLCMDSDGKLVVESTANQDSPLMHAHTPLLGLDLWEHAYYLKYQNRRADYVEAFFNVIDWNAVTERYLRVMRKEAHATLGW